MAEFTTTYLPDGSKRKCLTFMGTEYICRSSAFQDGVSHQLDDDICDQLEATGIFGSKLLDLVYGAFDDMVGEDPRDAIVQLTNLEQKAK